MKTTTLKKSEFQKAWHLLDATDISVGRLASRVSLILKGKNKPQYSPNLPVGDGVIIVNTDKVKFSGNKNTDKKYYKHTGHPGGIKETTPDKPPPNTVILRSTASDFFATSNGWLIIILSALSGK